MAEEKSPWRISPHIFATRRSEMRIRMDMKRDNPEGKKKVKGKNGTARKVVIFLAIMLASMVGGFILGAAISYSKKNGVDYEGIVSYISALSMKVLPWFYVGLSVVSALTAFIIFIVFNRRAAAWDGEDEEEIERIEAGLGNPIAIANSMMIFNMLLFSMHVWNTLCADTDSSAGNKMLGTIIFLINYAWIVVVSRLTVELEKKLNPEKKGDVLETNFSRKWEESCDEAQKMIIYEAGYRAYRAGMKACTFIWLVTFISMFMFNTGLMPVFTVCIIWFIMMICYTVQSGKLERNMYR